MASARISYRYERSGSAKTSWPAESQFLSSERWRSSASRHFSTKESSTSQTIDAREHRSLSDSDMLRVWLRAGLASVLSQIVDTLLFVTIAFYGVFPIGQLLVGQMLAKVVLSAVLVPPLIYLFVALGRKLDRA